MILQENVEKFLTGSWKKIFEAVYGKVIHQGFFRNTVWLKLVPLLGIIFPKKLFKFLHFA